MRADVAWDDYISSSGTTFDWFEQQEQLCSSGNYFDSCAGRDVTSHESQPRDLLFIVVFISVSGVHHRPEKEDVIDEWEIMCKEAVVA
jgi:hypothetical protein